MFSLELYFFFLFWVIFLYDLLILWFQVFTLPSYLYSYIVILLNFLGGLLSLCFHSSIKDDGYILFYFEICYTIWNHLFCQIMETIYPILSIWFLKRANNWLEFLSESWSSSTWTSTQKSPKTLKHRLFAHWGTVHSCLLCLMWFLPLVLQLHDTDSRPPTLLIPLYPQLLKNALKKTSHSFSWSFLKRKSQNWMKYSKSALANV